MVMRWVAKSVGSAQLTTAALWVRIQASLKNHKWAKVWPTHWNPPKKYFLKSFKLWELKFNV
jgi:hypothetical protein